MANILITGGTGLIGSSLIHMLLDNNHTVTILTRKIPATAPPPGVRFAIWDIDEETIDSLAIDQADYIVHLAGAGVADKRWTANRKQEILKSRVESSRLLIKALEQTPNHVKAVISSSAIGWYGADEPSSPHLRFEETAAADTTFLGSTCQAWEESISPVTTLGKRLVILRTGIVLSQDGGAYPEFIKPLQAGIATILSHGNQVISWIHIHDICRMFLFAIENAGITGVFNAVAPTPVTNKELMLKLARIKRGRMYIPIHIPSFILKIMLGEMSVEILKSATVSSKKIQATGYQFTYSNIDVALEALQQKVS